MKLLNHEFGRSGALLLTALVLPTVNSASALTLDDIQVWAGSGTNRAAIVIEWSSPEVLAGVLVPPPIATKTFAWGYRWDGSATAAGMLKAVAAADPRLAIIVSDPGNPFVFAFAFDLNNNRLLGVQDGAYVLSYSPLTNASSFTNGIAPADWGDADYFQSLDVADLYWGGANGPGWECWTEAGGSGGFGSAPDRGSSPYWTPDDAENPWTGDHGQWHLADAGLAATSIHDGSWVGFTVTAGELDFLDPTAPGTIAYNYHKHAPAGPEAASAILSPYGAELVAVQGSFGSGAQSSFGSSPLYTNVLSVLGEPVTYNVNSDPGTGYNPYHIKIVEPAYNVDVDSKESILTLSRARINGTYVYGGVTIAFDHPVLDNPANPYGVDFQVFGNAFYLGSGTAGGYVSDTSDMRTYYLAGGVFEEPMLVSVSPDGENWYTYESGPFCDTAFPTQGCQWDAEGHDQTGNGWTKRRMDFTKPVNPSLNDVLGVPGLQTYVADALALYAGSGGGTGFDIAESGFESIRYVRIQAAAGYSDGEVDAISAVRPAVLGEGLVVTPQNIRDHNSAFLFQDPAQTGKTLLRLDFAAIDDMALVTPTRALHATNLTALAGKALEALDLTVVSPLGLTNVPCGATATLNLAQRYQGDGSDIDMVQWNGTNWNRLAFLFDTVGKSVVIEGITESLWLAVIQIAPPLLTIAREDAAFAFSFTPMPGWTHELQRSSDFTNWEVIKSDTPEDSAPVVFRDNNPPDDKAFYRLRLMRP